MAQDRDPLPTVQVPLDPGVAEPLLDMRAATDRVYDDGRYGEQLDYTKPPAPPLREPDASWRVNCLRPGRTRNRPPEGIRP